MAGAIYVNGKIMEGKANKNVGGGDTVEKKSSYQKQELIEKIAAALQCQKAQPVKEHVDREKVAGLLLKASKALKAAADNQRKNEALLEKLAIENKRLHLEMIAKTRADEAEKLAKLMNEKGLIKKADIDAKIEELCDLEDNAFIMFKQAVENIHVNYEKDGIDSLTFLAEDTNIKYRKETLADSIESAVNGY